MIAELWRLTMENGEIVDVIVVNAFTPQDHDWMLYPHVPKHTTIHTRELIVRWSHAPCSFPVPREFAEKYRD